VYKICLLCLALCIGIKSDRMQELATLSHPSQVSKESLPLGDPIAFMKKCIEKFDQAGINGYKLVLLKQERLGGILQPSEEINVNYLTKPHSVLFSWVKGERMAARALYVEGSNKDKVLVHPAGVAGKLLKVVERDVDGDDAKRSGRYTLKEFGIRATMVRTLGGFERAKAGGYLKLTYLGVLEVKELNNRLCYAFKRNDPKPQEDGFTEVTVYFDKENWLQVGTLLKAEDGKVIGEYLFRDVQINPTFKADQFTKAAVAE
jgi:Protein of unknown function (DUF1571)